MKGDLDVGWNTFVPREELPDNDAGQAYYWHVQPCRDVNQPDSCTLDPEGRRDVLSLIASLLAGVVTGFARLITGVRGDPDHPANFGRLCTKGSTLHLTASAPVIPIVSLDEASGRPYRVYDPCIWKEGDQFIAHAMPLDVASSGPTPETARQAVDEAVRLFLATAAELIAV